MDELAAGVVVTQGFWDALLGELAAAAAAVRESDADHRLIVEAARGSNGDDEHDIEGASIAFERAQVEGQQGRARARLDRVRAALVRLDEGRYGRCIRCGGAVAAERLAAIPSVETCVDCAR